MHRQFNMLEKIPKRSRYVHGLIRTTKGATLMKAAVLAAEGLEMDDTPMRASGGKGVDPIVDQAIFAPPVYA